MDGLHDLLRLVVPQNDVRKSGLAIHPERPGQRGLTKVAIHQEDPIAELCHRQGQIARRRALSLLHGRTGDGYRVDALFHGHKLNVRPELPIALCQRGLGVEIRDQPRTPLQGFLIPLDAPLLQRVSDVIVGRLWNKTQHRDAHVFLHVLDGADGRIQCFHYEREHQSEHYADHRTDQRLGHRAGRIDPPAGKRPLDNAHFLLLFVLLLDRCLLVLLLQHNEEHSARLDLVLQPAQLHALLRKRLVHTLKGVKLRGRQLLLPSEAVSPCAKL